MSFGDDTKHRDEASYEFEEFAPELLDVQGVPRSIEDQVFCRNETEPGKCGFHSKCCFCHHPQYFLHQYTKWGRTNYVALGKYQPYQWWLWRYHSDSALAQELKQRCEQFAKRCDAWDEEQRRKQEIHQQRLQQKKEEAARKRRAERRRAEIEADQKKHKEELKKHEKQVASLKTRIDQGSEALKLVAENLNLLEEFKTKNPPMDDFHRKEFTKRAGGTSEND